MQRPFALRMRRLFAVSALLGASVAPAVATAQTQPTFYLDRLQMAGAPDDGVGIWRPQMGDKSRFYGQLGLGFSLNPYRVENYIDKIDQAEKVQKENGNPVTSQLTTYLNAGVEILDRFAFQVSFPLAVYQTNSSLNNPDALINYSVDRSTTVPMDLRLDGRAIFFRTDDRSIKLGAMATLWFPSGNRGAFGGDGSIHGALGVSAEYDAKVVAVVLNAGYHFRPHVQLNEFKLADELMFGAGVFAPFKNGRYRLGAEVVGSMGVGDNTTGDVDNLPIEWRVEGRMGLGADPTQVWIGLSGGTRLSAGYAPDFRSVAVIGGWFPVVNTKPKNRDFQYVIPGDADHDKLPDDIDMCPTAAEDGKGSRPDDGCPEMLNDIDSDGVPDAEDACPKEPGPRSTEPAKNGCPEFIRRKKDSELIEVLKEVEFAFDKSDLLPPAFPILNEVVRLLKVNTDIELVRIEGHTDDVGSLKYNDELSQDRADSVMRYLSERGIAADRLEAKGFGKRRPIVDNSTAEGRQKNRRVEFHIVKSKGNPPVLSTPSSETPPPAGTPAPGGTATPPPASPAPAPSPAAPATPPKPGTTAAPAAPPAPKPGTTATPAAPPK